MTLAAQDCNARDALMDGRMEGWMMEMVGGWLNRTDGRVGWLVGWLRAATRGPQDDGDDVHHRRISGVATG